jgi:hypothetical protein
VKWLYLHKYKGGFWFRIFGYGLSVVNRRINDAPFSIREGHNKELRIFNYGISVLKP